MKTLVTYSTKTGNTKKVAESIAKAIENSEIKDIAETLGHKRIETTQKYYILSLKENKKKVTKVFEENINLNDV